ncbi:MAG: hypothetical protein A2048_04165 [Deltaproteobacteria bacterium GWA2_45_12]|nr:MAG: hypothetical protein A2048_04165 [Deltaproteobacteria bacterium GWA2_45_12]
MGLLSPIIRRSFQGAVRLPFLGPLVRNHSRFQPAQTIHPTVHSTATPQATNSASSYADSSTREKRESPLGFALAYAHHQLSRLRARRHVATHLKALNIPKEAPFVDAQKLGEEGASRLLEAKIREAKSQGKPVLVFIGCGTRPREIAEASFLYPDAFIVGIEKRPMLLTPSFFPEGNNYFYYQESLQSAFSCLRGESLVNTVYLIAPHGTAQKELIKEYASVLEESGKLIIVTETLSAIEGTETSLARCILERMVGASSTLERFPRFQEKLRQRIEVIHENIVQSVREVFGDDVVVSQISMEADVDTLMKYFIVTSLLLQIKGGYQGYVWVIEATKKMG